MFCKKCDGLLVPRDGRMVCSQCGSKAEEDKTIIKSKVKTKPGILATKGRDGQFETLPKIEGVVCSKCKNNEAYYWLVQTRAADEAPTRFFRCTKCSHTWREYS